ncbi:hypothetical protein HYT54_00285 [Candidatus Woesearchaeota archaeon]|nr:hypothetical protein [Candidatus Woesearchaeota archaeon]
MGSGVEQAITDALRNPPPAIVQQAREISSPAYAQRLVDELDRFYLGFDGQAKELGAMAAELKSSFLQARIVVAIYPDTGYVRFVDDTMEVEIFDFGYDGSVDSVVVHPFSSQNIQPNRSSEIIFEGMPGLKPGILCDFYNAVGRAAPAAGDYLYHHGYPKDNPHKRRHMSGKGHRE